MKEPKYKAAELVAKFAAYALSYRNEFAAIECAKMAAERTIAILQNVPNAKELLDEEIQILECLKKM